MERSKTNSSWVYIFSLYVQGFMTCTYPVYCNTCACNCALNHVHSNRHANSHAYLFNHITPSSTHKIRSSVTNKQLSHMPIQVHYIPIQLRSQLYAHHWFTLHVHLFKQEMNKMLDQHVLVCIVHALKGDKPLSFHDEWRWISYADKQVVQWIESLPHLKSMTNKSSSQVHSYCLKYIISEFKNYKK